MKSFQNFQFSFDYENDSSLLKSRLHDCGANCVYKSVSRPSLQEGEDDCRKLILLWN